MSVTRYRNGSNYAAIAHIAATEHLGIGVQNLIVKSRLGDTHPVALPRDRGEVAAEHQPPLSLLRKPGERDDGFFGIPEVHPFKSRVVKVHLVKSALGTVEPVQLLHQLLQLPVRIKIQKVPRYAAVVIPLGTLADIASH